MGLDNKCDIHMLISTTQHHIILDPGITIKEE